VAEKKSKKKVEAAASVPARTEARGELTVTRSMPESLAAEAAVLGSMIVDPRCIGDVVELLNRHAFYHSEHQMLFDAIISLYEKNRGEGIDGVLVRDELTRRSQLEAIGGAEYLQRVIETVPSSANVQYYAEIVREKMLLRETISVATEILNDAYDETGETSEKLDEAERKIFAVTDKRITSAAVALKDLVTRAYELIEKREGTHVTGLATGYYELDDTTCGLQPGEMIIVAGRPSMGKAQPLDAKVLTPSGWKCMGALRVGEAVASLDGKPSLVSGIYPQGRRQIYRITFADGRSTECCAEHLWRVNYRGWDTPRILSTQRLIQMLGRKRYVNRLWIDTFTGEFGNDADLPLDPWLLGFLLGDGALSGSSVRFSTSDEEMLARVEETAGSDFAITSAGGYDYRLTQAGGAHAVGVLGVKPNPIKTVLQTLGLWGVTAAQKHVPAAYKSASRAGRARLLCGLLDTDGWVEKWGSLRFATVSERLAKDVVDLMRSLGGTGSYTAKQSTYTYRGHKQEGLTAFVCNLQHPEAALFVELSHKKARLAAGRQRQRRLNIVRIEPTRVVPTQCIAVTHPAHLYLTDDFIVTHNTALALNMAEHAGIVDKVPLAIFSLEMGRQQLAERFLCSYSGVDAQLVRKGMLSTDHYQKLVRACGAISEAPIYIDDTSALTPLELRAKARRLKSAYGIQCIFVDYLQLMSLGSSRIESRQQEISTISRYLKSLARELNVPVVVLSQLNRSPEGREGHRPRMSDLRESGSIEQDADVVILLHREDYYHRGEDGYEPDNTAEVIIAKQRNGPTGTVKLTFMEKCTRFENQTITPVGQEAVPF
jgi:replicative DNA helicase